MLYARHDISTIELTRCVITHNAFLLIYKIQSFLSTYQLFAAIYIKRPDIQRLRRE